MCEIRLNKTKICLGNVVKLLSIVKKMEVLKSQINIWWNVMASIRLYHG
jgi:hypothetical protein